MIRIVQELLEQPVTLGLRMMQTAVHANVQAQRLVLMQHKAGACHVNTLT